MQSRDGTSCVSARRSSSSTVLRSAVNPCVASVLLLHFKGTLPHACLLRRDTFVICDDCPYRPRLPIPDMRLLHLSYSECQSGASGLQTKWRGQLEHTLNDDEPNSMHFSASHRRWHEIFHSCAMMGGISLHVYFFQSPCNVKPPRRSRSPDDKSSSRLSSLESPIGTSSDATVGTTGGEPSLLSCIGSNDDADD